MNQPANLNTAIRAWGGASKAALQAAFARLNIQHVERSPSPNSSREALATRFGSRQGMVNKIGFRFPRHMVFVHKGVGKGVPISRAGSADTTRRAKEWFNPVMDERVGELADTVAEGTGDYLVNNLIIK